MDKSRKRIAQDYARNAIVDGNTKEGRYEKKMAVKEAAGEGPSMKSSLYMSGTSMGSGVNMKSGCTISKHMKGSGMNMSSSSRHDSGGPKMAPLVGMAIKALAPMVMGKIADKLGKKSDK